MKKNLNICFAIFLTLFFTSCVSMGGGDAPAEMLSITKNIDVPNTSKEQLFVTANEWAVNAFYNADSVIEYSDKDAGKIVGKYCFNLPYGLGDTMTITSIITIDIKDNKTRIIINKPYYRLFGGIGSVTCVEGGFVKDVKTITRVRKEWILLIENFEQSVSTPIETDW